jgi:hypothetical protein
MRKSLIRRVLPGMFQESGDRHARISCFQPKNHQPASQFMTKPKLSIRTLAKKTGADRASIAKWIAGIDSEEEALATIREHQKNSKAGAIDPATGLTWFQAKLREDTLRQRRENQEADEVQAERWMLTSDHFRMVKALVDRIEAIPSKASSELGLTSPQAIGIRRMLDEARTAAGKQIAAMGGQRA